MNDKKYIIYHMNIEDIPPGLPSMYPSDKRIRGVRNATSIISVDNILAVHETLTGCIIRTSGGDYEIAIHDDISAVVEQLIDFIINGETRSYTIH